MMPTPLGLQRLRRYGSATIKTDLDVCHHSLGARTEGKASAVRALLLI